MLKSQIEIMLDPGERLALELHELVDSSPLDEISLNNAICIISGLLSSDPNSVFETVFSDENQETDHLLFSVRVRDEVKELLAGTN